MLRLLTVVFSLVVLSGCATPSLTPDIASGIENGKLATAAYVVDKKVTYNEMVYKVLWNETRTQEAVFEGFWDIDQEYTDKLTAAASSQNLNAEPAASVVSPESYEEFEKSVFKSPQLDSEGAPVGLNLTEKFRTELTQAGYEYLMALRSSGIFVQSNAITDTAILTIPSAIFVVDLSEDKIVHVSDFPIQGFPEFEESVRELEDNGLILIREATKERLDEGLQAHLESMFAE
ncbi:hypothetical protein NLU14_10760 [Marinobacter sp. 71-i]|uniref:DUF3313 domain-containing protein n=1 Tax=Marinobacter iranensis TaxID=2962607 RepID=A0ABT5YAW7_9GAMM|nr:hypothetical protein [Marinobacter iranensis]MDF0750709.1 hypothetical protein [Marinobacter iranensis]